MSPPRSPLAARAYERAVSVQRVVSEILQPGLWPSRDRAPDFLFSRLQELYERGLIQDGPGMPNGPVF